MLLSPANSNAPLESTSSLLVGIWEFINHRRRIQISLLLLVMLANGAAELISLGSIIPFLGALSDPYRLWEQPVIKFFAGWFGVSQANDLVLLVTFGFISAIVVSACIRLLNLWLNGRMAAAIGSDLSCDAYRHTLCQPYAVHLKLNSSSAITGITTHIDRTVTALFALMQLITAAFLVIFLFTGLLLIDWVIACAAAVLFGSVYALLAMTVKKNLRRNSHLIAEASKQQIKSLQEGLGAIRDVLLDNNQQNFVDYYRRADRPQRFLLAQNRFLTIFPRYGVEALGMSSIALLGAGMVLTQQSGVATIPLLGALALGAQRLLPAIQQLYRGYSSVKGFNADLSNVLAMLRQPLPKQVNVKEALTLRESVRFDSVHFRYDSESPEVLNGLDLEIFRGERIGLIGSTGSGKSTTVDVLMGLLEPTAGKLLVDGLDLFDLSNTDLLLSWRAGIAHVPQSIYLADSSIAENIAFGVPKHQIDYDLVRRAAEQARIIDFIEASPDSFSSFVGERGIRLSGGQRQRIGIARALYKNAQLLILDEATSALDNNTEAEVMDAIDNLSQDLTIVMIAHRLSTLDRCDRIIDLTKC